jgi:hypothetical protein
MRKSGPRHTGQYPFSTGRPFRSTVRSARSSGRGARQRMQYTPSSSSAALSVRLSSVFNCPPRLASHVAFHGPRPFVGRRRRDQTGASEGRVRKGMVPDLALLTMARLIDAIAYSRVTTAIVALLLAPAERPERRVPANGWNFGCWAGGHAVSGFSNESLADGFAYQRAFWRARSDEARMAPRV